MFNVSKSVVFLRRPRVRICLPPTESPRLEGIRLPTSKDRALPRVCAAGRQKRHPTDTPTAFDLCHCSRCREASGSAFLAELEFKAAEFEWVCGQSLVRTYEAPVRKTPPWYRRTFCTVCGAPVPTVDRGIIRVPAGTLDGDPGIRPQRHLFVDFKAPWFEITDSLGQFGTKPKPS